MCHCAARAARTPRAPAVVLTFGTRSALVDGACGPDTRSLSLGAARRRCSQIALAAWRGSWLAHATLQPLLVVF